MHTAHRNLLHVNNSASTTANREEEIAFLAVEQVLGVDVLLSDAGNGDRTPDGTWEYPDERRGVVEVTSPPDKALMRQWALANRKGYAHSESGSLPVRANQLADVLAEMLSEGWAEENIAKILGEPADEHHLFLFARSHRVGHYFNRLFDSLEPGSAERVGDLEIPRGLTDLWVRGRAQRDRGSDAIEMAVTRFQAGSGWRRYTVHMSELHLPSPNSGIAEDPISSTRRPKERAKYKA